MSVFYKFKSALTYDTIQFDDLHITLNDFKKAVIQQKQLGKNTNFDLQVTNAETNEVYSEENSLIPKNASLIVVRVPLVGVQKKWDIGDQLSSKIGVISPDYLQENAGNIVIKSADLAAINASENDKIQAMMFQSTIDYDPANYLKTKGGFQVGDPPLHYICHKCQRSGHWIKDCPITVIPDIKKSSGIPLSFMTPVDDPSAPGALITPSGKFAVPTLDMQAYKQGKREKPYIPSEEVEEAPKQNIPENLTCTLCEDLLTDAVMMPCCGDSFCDECIRNVLLESEENQCPACKEKDISPETLVPSRYLRNAANNFRNKTGYSGGGQRVKVSKPEPSKSSTIDNDQDVEIIDTLPEHEPAPTPALTSDSVPSPPPDSELALAPASAPAPALSDTKTEDIKSDEETGKGSAIIVLNSGPPGRNSRPLSNGNQILPGIKKDHHFSPTNARPLVSDKTIDSQRNLIGSNKSSPDIRDGERRKSSPGVPPANPATNVVPPMMNNFSVPPIVLPNTSQLPPGYNQQHIRPIGGPYSGNPNPGVPPMMSNYGIPPGVNPMMMQPHMGPQGPNNRMFYGGPPPMFPNQVGGGYRGGPGHHRMRHPDPYDRNSIVEDPLVLFERHLRERERQDRLKRSRNRRSRSRSLSRGDSCSRSRQRSRSRSLSKKRSRSPGMVVRKESPLMKRDSRSPLPSRRSTSKGRIRGHRSRSPGHGPRGSLTRSKSRSPIPMKKKRGISTTLRSLSRSRSRSRKRRRTRSRSHSISRSLSRGRSYSRSVSPKKRNEYSPGYNSFRGKRYSRSPGRRQLPPSRVRGSNYHQHTPPYHPSQHYDSNDKHKRNPRNSRYHRGSTSRYTSSNQNYDHPNKYDRYGHTDYDEKRYAEMNNGRAYESVTNSKPFKDYYPPSGHYEVAYEEAPPGTIDVHYSDRHSYKETDCSERGDKYHSQHYEDQNAYTSNYKDQDAIEDYRKTRENDKERERDRDHDHHRRHSRDRSSHYHEHEKKHENSSTKYPEPKESKKGTTPEPEKARKDDDEKRDDGREKKDKTKRKKKKEADGDKDKEKKKKKKPKLKKDEEDLKNGDKNDSLEDRSYEAVSDEGKTEVVAEISHSEDGSENKDLPLEKPSFHDEEVISAVPELSKWEREDVPSSSDERRGSDHDPKVVTSEILKRAEHMVFQRNESARKLRKSGNSIQITVPAVTDESSEETRPPGRISAKHRLGAKVEDKNYAPLRSLVEPIIKPRSTVKAVVEVKHHKIKKESRHADHKRSKRRDSKEHKERSKKTEEESKNSSKNKERIPSQSPKEEVKNDNASLPNFEEHAIVKNITSEMKEILDKKRPVIDEANFEPNYDLTESEGEDNKTGDIAISKKTDVNEVDKEEKSSSDDSSDTSTDRRKRRAKKKKKVKKRRTHSSSESDSEDSSASESGSDSKLKHKKKRKHKSKKTSRTGKKKKKSKHK